MDLITARELVESFWGKDTTYSPKDYDGKDPAYGQCVVTALVVQDLCGGSIVCGEANENGKRVRHYWNRINGLDVDLTWRQFRAGTTVSKVKEVLRYQLTRQPAVNNRYKRLRQKIEGE